MNVPCMNIISYFGKLENEDLWMEIVKRYNDYNMDNNANIYFRQEELLDKDIVDIQMNGNEGILTYINMTSRGQSGGAVLQTSLIYDVYYNDSIQTSRLIGIHVAGHSEQSKCTLIVQTIFNWIKSIVLSLLTKHEQDWQKRMLNFMNHFEKFDKF